MKILRFIVKVVKTVVIFGSGAIIGAGAMYIFILHGLINDQSYKRRPSYYDNYRRRA